MQQQKMHSALKSHQQPIILWGRIKRPSALPQRRRAAAPNDREDPNHPPQKEEMPNVYYPTEHKAVEEAHRPFEPIVEPGTKVGFFLFLFGIGDEMRYN
ncbi:hypothetical protein DUNSADRAFT_10852 [Dunaliella salina]|uniref:Encoded protein n=1 Tax=Dunaliella salina TaxID=3046 RepID=A0ABQ7H9Z8_DUNSA|nr:hypothetical protein DUNSADRAFT_10852 [Dunaliella salina]|eukprot:KAF5843677.1 hypothetical protein DUNSADRAFT_10852 [Dunaliella salina]